MDSSTNNWLYQFKLNEIVGFLQNSIFTAISYVYLSQLVLYRSDNDQLLVTKL